jgi:hypothetical protein
MISGHMEAMNQTLPIKVRRSGEPFQVRHLVSSGSEVGRSHAA